MIFLKHEKDICAHWLYYSYNGIVIRFDADWISKENLFMELQEFKENFCDEKRMALGDDITRTIIESYSILDFVGFECFEEEEE